MDKDAQLIIHMVSSLDGIIAKKDNSVSWFDTADYYAEGADEESPEAFMLSIGCFIMGARTYEHALALSVEYGWPYGDVPTFVMSHKPLPVERNNVQIIQGGLSELVNEKLRRAYKQIWAVGGAVLSRELLRLNLADEICLSVLPVILGDGIRFFDESLSEQDLHLSKVTAYKSGKIEMRYMIKK